MYHNFYHLPYIHADDFTQRSVCIHYTDINSFCIFFCYFVWSLCVAHNIRFSRYTLKIIYVRPILFLGYFLIIKDLYSLEEN